MILLVSLLSFMISRSYKLDEDEPQNGDRKQKVPVRLKYLRSPLYSSDSQILIDFSFRTFLSSLSPALLWVLDATSHRRPTSNKVRPDPRDAKNVTPCLLFYSTMTDAQETYISVVSSF
jgi:hypothetical protein